MGGVPPLPQTPSGFPNNGLREGSALDEARRSGCFDQRAFLWRGGAGETEKIPTASSSLADVMLTCLHFQKNAEFRENFGVGGISELEQLGVACPSYNPNSR